MAGSSFQELLQNLAQQVQSMSMTVAAAVEASRKESDDLMKKNKALQAALVAKSSEVGAAATSQVSVKPKSFKDHLAGGTVKLVVFNRDLYVHRSILSSIPFFEAKLEHWCDEPVMLPEDITEPAFDHMLLRLYVGARLPARNVGLCAQIIHLAKYWLLDAIVTEMVAEVLQMVKNEDIPVLDELAKSFEIEELSVAVEKLQKEPQCSPQELEGILGKAWKKDGRQAQELCTVLLKGHPHGPNVLREKFAHCSLAVWSTREWRPEEEWRERRSETLHNVDLCPAFPWFWEELKGAGLLKTELPFISGIFTSKMNKSTGYRMDQLLTSLDMVFMNEGGTTVCERKVPTDATPSTLATALETCRNGRFLGSAVYDMVDAAAGCLRAGSLRPSDIRALLTLTPEHLLCKPYVDEDLAKLIADVQPATAHEVFQMMIGRITEVGPKTASALREIAAPAT